MATHKKNFSWLVHLFFLILVLILSVYLSQFFKNSLLKAYERNAKKFEQLRDNRAEAPPAYQLQEEINSRLANQ